MDEKKRMRLRSDTTLAPQSCDFVAEEDIGLDRNFRRTPIEIGRSKNCFQMQQIAALPILIQRRCIKYPEDWDVEDKYQNFITKQGTIHKRIGKSIPELTKKIQSKTQTLQSEGVLSILKITADLVSYGLGEEERGGGVGEIGGVGSALPTTTCDKLIRKIVHDIVPALVTLATNNNQIGCNSLYILTNLALFDSLHTQEETITNMIIQCLKSDQVSDDKLKAVLLFVGNLCIYSKEARKLLIDGDLISILSTLLPNASTYLDLLLLWNLHILCCSEFPIPTTHEVLIPVSKVLMGLDTMAKEESISLATEALKIFIRFLVEGDDGVIRQTVVQIVSAGLVSKLVTLLLSMLRSPTVLHFNLCVLTCIVIHDINQIKIAVDNKILSYLYGIIRHGGILNNRIMYGRVVMQACLLVSHIIAGDSSQIQNVIDNKLIDALVDAAKFDPFMRYTSLALLNVAVNGSREQIKVLLEKNCIEMISKKLLPNEDDDSLLISLQGLMNMLSVGDETIDGPNLHAEKVYWDKIGNMQQSKNEKIRDLAFDVAERFFIKR